MLGVEGEARERQSERYLLPTLGHNNFRSDDVIL